VRGSGVRPNLATKRGPKAAAIAPRVTLLTTVVMVPGAMILLIIGLYIGSDLDLGSFGGI